MDLDVALGRDPGAGTMGARARRRRTVVPLALRSISTSSTLSRMSSRPRPRMVSAGGGTRHWPWSVTSTRTDPSGSTRAHTSMVPVPGRDRRVPRSC